MPPLSPLIGPPPLGAVAGVSPKVFQGYRQPKPDALTDAGAPSAPLSGEVLALLSSSNAPPVCRRRNSFGVAVAALLVLAGFSGGTCLA